MFLQEKKKKKKCSPSLSPPPHNQQVDPSSYQKIFSELGVDELSPSGVLFVTDILAEGTAAKEAGWGVVMASRPGNAQLPEGHGFKVVNDFVEEIF